MMKLKNKLSSSKSRERKRVERAQSDGVRATADEDTLRMSKQVAEDAHRYARNTTMNTSAASSTSSYMSDDVEDMFYNGGGVTRSTSDYTTGRTTSSMHSTDSGANGMNRTTQGTSLRVTDVYRTTEQLRNTNLIPLNEDEVLPAAMRTTTTTTTATTGGTAGGSEADALRAELAEMKQEMQAIRREMMNEMHVTRL
ncbi:hypothetical protein FI667_g4984, partial [Globisporangium splendens]